MARLKKHEKLALQRQWLNIWEAAGSPLLTQGSYGVAPYDIKHFGVVQQTYGCASALAIFLGGSDLTPLLATLGGLRLCRSNTVNIRSGSGRNHDEMLLAGQARAVHLEAVLAHQHIVAIRAAAPEVADRMEVETFLETLLALKQGASSQPGGRL